MSDSAPPHTWHVITCEYPPMIGGVSDYTSTMAAALAVGGADVHVWAPDGDAGVSPGATSRVHVHRECGRFSPRDCVRVGRKLDTLRAPRCLFVQWVPHGYGWKSMNLPFAVWLAWRALVRGDELHLMVHEPFMRFAPRLAVIVLSLVHRLMFAIAGCGASRVWLSIDGWHTLVAPYLRRNVPRAWLAVPPPPLADTIDDSTPQTRARRRSAQDDVPLVGHFSSFGPEVTALLTPALGALLSQTSAQVLLMGRGSEAICHRLRREQPAFSARVHATGVVSTGDLGRHLASCDALLQPYPEGISARRTSALAALAHARPVVTNAGPLTEPFWEREEAVAFADSSHGAALAAAMARLLASPAEQQRLSTRAAAFVERHFSAAAAAAVLERSAAPAGAGLASLTSRAQA